MKDRFQTLRLFFFFGAARSPPPATAASTVSNVTSSSLCSFSKTPVTTPLAALCWLSCQAKPKQQPIFLAVTAFEVHDNDTVIITSQQELC